MIGRVARNLNGKAILYADQVTPAMREAIDETSRRRQRQIAFNEENAVVPHFIAAFTAFRDHPSCCVERA